MIFDTIVKMALERYGILDQYGTPVRDITTTDLFNIMIDLKNKGILHFDYEFLNTPNGNISNPAIHELKYFIKQVYMHIYGMQMINEQIVNEQLYRLRIYNSGGTIREDQESSSSSTSSSSSSLSSSCSSFSSSTSSSSSSLSSSSFSSSMSSSSSSLSLSSSSSSFSSSISSSSSSSSSSFSNSLSSSSSSFSNSLSSSSSSFSNSLSSSSSSLSFSNSSSSSSGILSSSSSSTVGPLELWTWGSNDYGQLGLGNTITKDYPNQVGSLTDWLKTSAGSNHSLLIKSDGTIWACGNNSQGELGLGDNENRSSPTQIGSDTNWNEISVGAFYSLATKSNGTLWSWGQCSEGKLGLGPLINKSTPTQVGDLTNWSKISAGDSHSLAIDRTNGLWAWGYNYYGQLGLGDEINTNRSSPTHVGSLGDWKEISCGFYHSLAIKTDGTLWAWGFNTSGQLGNGTVVNKSSPIQIGSDTNWSNVCGGYASSLAIKSNGTLWSWGSNENGILGLNDTINRSSPTQIGSDTDWIKTKLGYLSLAIKSDKSVWVWGPNGIGQLGLRDRINRSSPTRIGTMTNWEDLFSGHGSQSPFALRTYQLSSSSSSFSSSSSHVASTYTVIGAGTESYNGVYTENGTYEEELAYQNSNGNWLFWCFNEMEATHFWALNSEKVFVLEWTECAYYDGSSLPGTWNAGYGDLPAPTISSSSSSNSLSSSSSSLSNSSSSSSGILSSSSSSFELVPDYYVDSAGNDGYDGRAPVFDGDHGPKATINAAIGVATTGDCIQVASGTYLEQVNFLGKAITVRSANPDNSSVVAATIINGGSEMEGGGTAISFANGEGQESIIEGFTLTTSLGTGIKCTNGSSPTIRKNLIINNYGMMGGYQCSFVNSSPTFENNIVRTGAMGMFLNNSSSVIRNNVFAKNNGSGPGGGTVGAIWVYNSSPQIINNTFYSNDGGPDYGMGELPVGAIKVETGTPIITNCIFWDNHYHDQSDQIVLSQIYVKAGTPTVTYSDVQGGYAGQGNIDSDPLVVDAGDGNDYHEKSVAGHWTPSGYSSDVETSPCIDAGDTESAWNLEPTPNGSRINMGAYGNTYQASKTVS